MKAQVVTIDGPAASGKSSVSRELARRLGWDWVSTGAFYRGLAYVAYHKGLLQAGAPRLAELAQQKEVWSVQMTTQSTHVWFQGQDVTAEIGKEEIGTLASQISQYPEVRAALLNAQRQCAAGRLGLVAEGRDCGTVIFPQAEVKIFLTATAEDRAARRAKEEGKTMEETHSAQVIRDIQDTTRKAAPLLAAPDAHTVDTTRLTLIEVVEIVEQLVQQKKLKTAPSKM